MKSINRQLVSFILFDIYKKYESRWGSRNNRHFSYLVFDRKSPLNKENNKNKITEDDSAYYKNKDK